MGLPKLDTNFLRPFFEGTAETLSVQCSVKVKAGKPFPKTPENMKGVQTDLAAIIGLTSSSFNGSIALCFPDATFLKVMGGMLGEDFEEIDEDLEDGAGELLNIIFGFAKRVLNDKGYDIEKAIPSVVKGKDVKLQHLTEATAIIVPFASEAGKFHIEIVID